MSFILAYRCIIFDQLIKAIPWGSKVAFRWAAHRKGSVEFSQRPGGSFSVNRLQRGWAELEELNQLRR